MAKKNIGFSVHEYDFDGDILNNGIFLHFGDTRVKVADDLDEFKSVAETIAGMVKEIEENYNT